MIDMRSKFEDMTSDEAFRRVQEMDVTGQPSASYDPIFFPLFTAVFGTATIAGTGISVAGLASAITVTPVSRGVHSK